MKFLINNKTTITFGILLFSNFFIRFIWLDLPLLDGAATRHALNALAANYMHEEKLSLLFPRIHANGPSLYYHALEVQWIPFIIALLYKIFGVYPWFFRIVSIFFTLLTLSIFFSWLKCFMEKRFALLATFFLGFSPISIYIGRSALYEMPILFFNIATLFCFYQWTITKHIKYALWGGVALFFSATLKIPNLYLLLPIFYILYRNGGANVFIKSCWTIGISLACIIIVQLWLHHLLSLGENPSLVHHDFHYMFSRIFFSFTSLAFYKNIYEHALNYVLTPVGFILFSLGLILRKIKSEETIFYVWLCSVLIFYALMPEQFGIHGYYHIHYLPIAAFFISKTLTILDQLKIRRVRIFLILLFLMTSIRYTIPFFKIPDRKKYVMQTVQYIKQYVPKDAYIIASVDSPLILLFYSNHKGWGLDLSDSNKKYSAIIENLTEKGAQYLVLANKHEIICNPELIQYLRTSHQIIFENEFCWIIKLRKSF